MTIITDDFGLVQEDACEDAREEQQGERTEEQGVSVPLDPALKQLLEKRDDRLLRDIGLTRESWLVEAARFWSEWSRRRDPWHL